MPKLGAFIGDDLDQILSWIDGRGLLLFIDNEMSALPSFNGHKGEELLAQIIEMREGNFKFIYSSANQSQLFDLASEPYEMQNLTVDYPMLIS